MEFIDINAMLGTWTYKPMYMQEAAQLKQEMDRLGIAQAYVFDSKAWKSEFSVGNKATLDAVKGDDRLIPTMVLTPLLKQEFGGRDAVLETICKNRIGAVRLFPQSHSYTLHPWNVETLFELMNELRMPVLINPPDDNAGMEILLAQVYELCVAFPQTPVVLLSAGYRYSRMIYALWEQVSNFYVDTSLFIAYHGIEDAVKYFGSQNILFGTRFPLMEPGTYVGRILYSDLAAPDMENIAGGNIRRLRAGIKYPF